MMGYYRVISSEVAVCTNLGANEQGVVDLRSRRLLSAGRAVSLLGALAPVGSHLSRCSRRTLNGFLEYAHARENAYFHFRGVKRLTLQSTDIIQSSIRNNEKQYLLD